jgi:hypothetical protein
METTVNESTSAINLENIKELDKSKTNPTFDAILEAVSELIDGTTEVFLYNKASPNKSVRVSMSAKKVEEIELIEFINEQGEFKPDISCKSFKDYLAKYDIKKVPLQVMVPSDLLKDFNQQAQYLYDSLEEGQSKLFTAMWKAYKT